MGGVEKYKLILYSTLVEMEVEVELCNECFLNSFSGSNQVSASFKNYKTYNNKPKEQVFASMQVPDDSEKQVRYSK